MRIIVRTLCAISIIIIIWYSSSNSIMYTRFLTLLLEFISCFLDVSRLWEGERSIFVFWCKICIFKVCLVLRWYSESVFFKVASLTVAKIHARKFITIYRIILYTQRCAVVQQIYYTHKQSVIGWCVHVTTHQQITCTKKAAIMEGRVSVTVTVSVRVSATVRVSLVI